MVSNWRALEPLHRRERAFPRHLHPPCRHSLCPDGNESRARPVNPTQGMLSVYRLCSRIQDRLEALEPCGTRDLHSARLFLDRCMVLRRSILLWIGVLILSLSGHCRTGSCGHDVCIPRHRLHRSERTSDPAQFAAAGDGPASTDCTHVAFVAAQYLLMPYSAVVPLVFGCSFVGLCCVRVALDGLQRYVIFPGGDAKA